MDLTTEAIMARNLPARTHLMAMKVTKRTWYNAGGFANSRCFRRQKKGSGWAYYIDMDRR